MATVTESASTLWSAPATDNAILEAMREDKKRGCRSILGTPVAFAPDCLKIRRIDQYISSYPPWPPPPGFFSSSLGASAIKASEVRSSVLTLAAF